MDTPSFPTPDPPPAPAYSPTPDAHPGVTAEGALHAAIRTSTGEAAPDFNVEGASQAREAKVELRRAILAARVVRFAGTTAHGPAALTRAALDIRDRLSGLIATSQPSTVAAYLPFGTEPGGADLPEFLGRLVTNVIVPVLLPDKDLNWRPFDEPGLHLGVDAIAAAELIIVPALAVDQAGYRLGRGGGSYDRALARAGSTSMIVALLHDGELVPHVPHEPHDHRVHVALAPSALVKLDR